MKSFFILLLTISLTHSLYAQSTDSIKNALLQEKNDSIRFRLMGVLFYKYLFSNPDSAAKYVQQEMALAKKMKWDLAWFYIASHYSDLSFINGNYPEALQFALQSLKTAEQMNDFISIASACSNLNDIYRELGDYKNAIYYGQHAKSLFDANFKRADYNEKKNTDTALRFVYILHGLALTYEKFNHLDSALTYIRLVDEIYTRAVGKMNWAPVPYVYGNIFYKTGNYVKALENYHRGIAFADNVGIEKDIMDNCNGLAKTFIKIGRTDSSIFYAKKILKISEATHYPIVKLNALTLLATIYKSKNNIDSAVKYFELTIATNDSLFNQEKVIQIQNMTFNEQLRQQQILEERRQYQNRIRTYMLISGLVVLLLVAGILYRNNRQKRKANIKIKKAYEELKTTQAQLIQSEKMASLGELTAGIAHEIQNPLNFVNNFSEVNTELIEEMKNELNAGNKEDALSIADSIKENEQKINHHGKRADAIVKGMLQHSRSSTGQKEPTDINALADEYLRLSYHGLRAKDKTFNAAFETDFDQNIGNIEVVPQDIGRMLLNLFNNAFYSVSEKKKQQPEGYEPTISVGTKKLNDKIEIRVKDNGMGIPQKALEKIYQPFFSTKPTGQGTGLGLSISYDIIKTHGGELKVETKEGEFAEFKILLPS